MAHTTAVPISPTFPNPHAAHFRAAGSWPQQSLATLFARTAQGQATRECLIDDTQRLTFRDLDGFVAPDGGRTAQSLGLGRGDVIAYQLPNWWEAVVVFLAAPRLGAIVNPLLPIFRESELRFTLQQSQARALIIPGVLPRLRSSRTDRSGAHRAAGVARGSGRSRRAAV